MKKVVAVVLLLLVVGVLGRALYKDRVVHKPVHTVKHTHTVIKKTRGC